MIYIQTIDEQYKDIDEEIKKTQKILEKLPQGKIICSKSKNSCKWYNTLNGKTEYIPKKDKEYAQQLAYRKYLECKLETLNKRKYILANSKKLESITAEKMINLLSNPYYQELLQPYHIIQDKNEWMNQPFIQNPYQREKCTHETVYGIKVRSKSESHIAIVLAEHHIPFRYECQLVLGEEIFYPDFTILKGITNKKVYWEHHGMMDKENYYHDYAHKMKIYTQNNIQPGVNLIQTYEDKEHPLTYQMAEKIVQLYLL